MIAPQESEERLLGRQDLYTMSTRRCLKGRKSLTICVIKGPTTVELGLPVATMLGGSRVVNPSLLLFYIYVLSESVAI